MIWRICLKGTILAALATLGIFVAGCGRDSGRATDPMRMTGPAAQIPENESAHNAAPVQIVIDNFTFKPEELAIPAGTKVTWVNHDDVPHTATSNTKPRQFDSGTLDTDEQFSFTFTKPGTYDYFCALHKHMTARIIVQ